MGLLEGRACIVTGAGNGIGRVTALELARAGASVLANDLGCERDGRGHDPGPAEAVVAEIRRSGGQAVASHHDVATAEGANAAVELASSSFGRIDTLVNCAGVFREASLLDASDEDLDAVLRAALRAAFHCIKAVVPHMRSSGGRIVNTTAIQGLLGSHGEVAYAAANAAAYALTRTASIELQRFGIMVNAVAPLASTRMTADTHALEGRHDLAPEHVVGAYVFFASDLSGQRTGQALSVAAGRVSLIKLVETAGRFKEADGGVWTADEIAEHWNALARP